MSRIAALLNRDGSPVDPAVLHKLAAPLRNKSSEGPRFWRNGQAGLAYQRLQNSSGLDDIQPAILPARVAVCLDGRLDNREELMEKLSASLGPGAEDLPDSSLVLACYRHFGDSFAAQLNGDFAVAVYDEERRQMLLARDPAGIRPLYSWVSRKLCIAASEIKGILAHPEVEARPEDEALADLIIGGDPHELRLTYFKGVLRVRPGHTIIVTPEALREFRHWDFDPLKKIRLSSFEEYAEALRALFEQAVRRRLRSTRPVGVLVSGGLDSSAILCQAEVLRRAGSGVAPAIGVSMVFPEGSPADEKQYLADIEEMFQVSIRKLPFTSFKYEDGMEWMLISEIPRMRWDSEIERLRACHELGCSTVLNGDFGDQIISSSAHLFELARRLRWGQLQSEFKRMAGTLTDCPPARLRKYLMLRFVRDLMPDQLMFALRAVRHLRHPRGLSDSYTESFHKTGYRRSQKQRRVAGPFASKQAEITYGYFNFGYVADWMEVNNKHAAAFGMENAEPFLDRDLVQFVMSIPAELPNWQGVFKGLFREAMRGVLPESIRLRGWKADFTKLDSDAMYSRHSRFQEYLHPNCMAVRYGYVDPAIVQGAFNTHKAKLTGETGLASREANALVALELWLRTFLNPVTLGR